MSYIEFSLSSHPPRVPSPPTCCYLGAVKASDIRDHLTENTALVTIMHSNNEVGTLQPLKEIARHVHTFNTSKRSDVLLHTDAGEQSLSDVVCFIISPMPCVILFWSSNHWSSLLITVSNQPNPSPVSKLPVTNTP